MSSHRDPSRSRARPREVAELEALAERQPELASAANLQIELVEAVRRVQGRLSTPWIETSPDEMAARLAAGRSLVSIDQIAFEWSDVRLLVRQVTDILRRHGAIEDAAATTLEELGRSPDLPAAVHRWFAGQEPVAPVEMLDEVLTWATRPYVQRTAEVLQQRMTFDTWNRGTCPVCGAEPHFSVLTLSGERYLVCGRCHARWAFDTGACPFCPNRDRARLTSLTTADGMYQVAACQRCRRYIKAIDLRRSTRPLLPLVDPIATLTLDAAVMQRGFGGTTE